MLLRQLQTPGPKGGQAEARLGEKAAVRKGQDGHGPGSPGVTTELWVRDKLAALETSRKK